MLIIMFAYLFIVQNWTWHRIMQMSTVQCGYEV